MTPALLIRAEPFTRAEPSDPAVDIGRDEAARAARAELAKPAYQADQPGLIERVLQWIAERVADLFGSASAAMPGGPFGLVLLVLLIVLALVVILTRVGPLARARARQQKAVFGARPRTAAEHRADADSAAARGDLDTAVRERFRAIVRDLIERAVLDERPGRTADETAREVAAVSAVSAVSSDAAGSLREAALVFDEVCYGDRAATRQAYDVVKAADDAIRAVRA